LIDILLQWINPVLLYLNTHFAWSADQHDMLAVDRRFEANIALAIGKAPAFDQSEGAALAAVGEVESAPGATASLCNWVIGPDYEAASPGPIGKAT